MSRDVPGAGADDEARVGLRRATPYPGRMLGGNPNRPVPIGTCGTYYPIVPPGTLWLPAGA